jgi:putative transposase
VLIHSFEALEPIRQGVRQHFGAFAKDFAGGLSVRHDRSSQYMSDAFQSELRFLGIESSPAFVRAPEGNGCAERFIRSLKENLLWVRTFETVEELRLALLAFRETYNTTWLIERHGVTTPQIVRQNQLQPAASVARCLIPGFDGAVFSLAWKEALWARFFTAAPPRQRRSVERYSIVKRA